MELLELIGEAIKEFFVKFGGELIMSIISVLVALVIAYPKNRRKKEREKEERIAKQNKEDNQKTHEKLDETNGELQALKEAYILHLSLLITDKFYEAYDSGFMTTYERSEIQQLYQVYKNLGANHHMDDIYKRAMGLPIKTLAEKEDEKANKEKEGED